MNHAKPIFDPATHYRIEIRGRVDVEWLQNFGGSTEIIVDVAKQSNDVSVLDVNTDQAGIVGLVCACCSITQAACPSSRTRRDRK